MTTHTMEVVTRVPSNAVRAQDHPILESGNLSFPKGRYRLDISTNHQESCCILEHRIKGARFIDQLLQDGRAQFACVASSPTSAYRNTYISAEARHKVCWSDGDHCEPPLLTPMVLCVKSCNVTVDSDRDNVHPIWDGERIKLQKGSRLALGNVVHFRSSIFHLLKLIKDDSLSRGQFVIDVNEEPFRFIVKLNADLHGFLQFDKSPIRKHIMTHIVTACLARLQEKYNKDDGESGWRSFRSLAAFAEYLDSRSQLHWGDSDFRPEKVATALYPHKLPDVESDL